MSKSLIRPIENDRSLTPLPKSAPRRIFATDMTLPTQPRALLFDVFGTCVNWRESVVNELYAQAHAALNSASASLASRVRMKASNMTTQDWGTFAQQWRDKYKEFTRTLAADPSIPWVSVDEHYLTSLKELMVVWEIEGLWTDEELQTIGLIWHRLEPWEDSVKGVELFNQLFYTCTLSNGNQSLLADLRSHSKIPFTHLFSAEDFGTYKPAARVYLGAAEKLNLSPGQCAMVAAHLNDLEGAKKNGLQTIYVERPGEEEWNEDEVESAKREGWVDIWVSARDGSRGFVTVAEKLGIDVSGIGGTRRLSTGALPGGA